MNQIIETGFQRLSPMRQLNAEITRDLCAVETGIGRASRGARIVGRCDRGECRDASATAGESGEDCLRKAVPGGLAGSREMVDAGMAGRAACDDLLRDLQDRARQIGRSRWCATLIAHDLHELARLRQLQHRCQKISTRSAVEPGRAQDQRQGSAFADGPFSLKLGMPINIKRRGRVVFTIWLRLAAVEDIVGGNQNVGNTDAGRCRREARCSVAVDGKRALRFRFGSVDCRVGGSIHDQSRLQLTNGRCDRAAVLDVQLGAAESDERHIATLGKLAQSARQLAAAASDKNDTSLAQARSIRGFEHAQAFSPVNASPYRFPPGAVLEVPADGALKSALEAFARLPCERLLRFRGINGISKIMARAIGHKSDQRSPRIGRRNEPIKYLANLLDHSEIAALAIPTKIVFLANASTLEQVNQSGCVVIDKKPIPHVAAIAVN